MSSTKDSFDDDELTTMAAEIMHDLQTKQNLDPTDSNQYLFKSDDSMDDVKLSNLPSLSYLSSLSTEGHIVYVNYPSMSPNIISDSKLTPNDSFNIPIPTLPPPKHKPAINGWCQINKNKPPVCGNILPYIPPPSIYIDQTETDIIARKHNKAKTSSQIPIFSENVPNINHNVYNKYNDKKQRKYKNKCKTVSKPKISKIFIDFDKQTHREAKHNSKATSVTPFVRKTERKNRKRKKQIRAGSDGFEMHRYIIGLENAYMFNTDIV